jgi:[ribosomal protein S5]-alanine N-acetyltransferase
MGSRSVDAFRTDRLLAERLREEHLGEIRRMHRDPNVMATLGGLRSDEETTHYLRDNLDHWDRYGYGMWVFRDRAHGRFVGRAGLRNTHVGCNDEVELAYALVADYWGRGLATEMATEILKLAFERLDLDDIVCFTLPTNLASRRVMEKVGFEYERDVVHAGSPHVLYRINAPDT